MAFSLAMLLLVCCLHAQDIPSSSAKLWRSDREAQFARQLQAMPEQACALDASHTYTLAELVDLAESHNPDTRVAWQNAKA